MNDMNIFFKNDKGIICYNPKCITCNNTCKQSYRAQILSCPLTKQERTKKRR